MPNPIWFALPIVLSIFGIVFLSKRLGNPRIRKIKNKLAKDGYTITEIRFDDKTTNIDGKTITHGLVIANKYDNEYGIGIISESNKNKRRYRLLVTGDLNISKMLRLVIKNKMPSVRLIEMMLDIGNKYEKRYMFSTSSHVLYDSIIRNFDDLEIAHTLQNHIPISIESGNSWNEFVYDVDNLVTLMKIYNNITQLLSMDCRFQKNGDPYEIELVETCSVCFQIIDDASSLVRLECCGTFAHQDHLSPWFERENSCPFCKSDAPKLYHQS